MNSKSALRVGILGSCVSRDAFALAPDPGCELQFYVARTNYISLQSDPLTEGVEFHFEAKEGVPFSPWRKRIAEWELTKVHRRELRKVVQRLDLMVLDLIDDRVETAFLEDGRCFVLSGELLNNVVVDTDYTKTQLITEPSWRQRWLDAGCAFLSELQSTNPALRFVYHKAPFCLRTSQGPDLPVPYFMKKLGARRFLARWNQAQDEWLGRIQGVLSSLSCIEVDPRFHLADGHHRWGPAPFHYIHEYYPEFMNSLLGILGSP